MLKNVILDTQKDNLVINISLDFINSKKIENFLIKSGIQVIFYGEIEIVEVRNWLWDRKIYSKSLNTLITFNPIKNDFELITKDGSKKITSKSFDNILKKLGHIKLKVPLWKKSQKTKNYSLILKFSLKKQVPFWIEKTLFFWNWNISPNVEYTIDFRY
jgi:hypothetical protein